MIKVNEFSGNEYSSFKELLSNFELGRLYGKKGDIMEFFASDAARKRKEWDFKKWGKRVNFFLNHIEKSFNPDLIILGGGVSKKIAHAI